MILQGVYVVNKWWAAVAASGIVLGAAYMLWLYQRTMFGKVENPANTGLKDLTLREVATFVPLIALAVWIGLYPSPILRRLETSVARVVVRVNPAYGPAYAKAGINCTPSAEARAAAQAAAPPGFTVEPPCDDPKAAPKSPKGGH